MYGKVFREVGEVIDNMDPKDTLKISSDFLKTIIKKADWSYDFKYDKSKSIMEQNLSDDAQVLLSVIYLRYFASKEEKLELIKLMKKNDEKDEELKRKKYDVNNIFGNSQLKNEVNYEKNNDSTYNKNNPLTIVNEKWYKKIGKSIKLFFQRFK